MTSEKWRLLNSDSARETWDFDEILYYAYRDNKAGAVFVLHEVGDAHSYLSASNRRLAIEAIAAQTNWLFVYLDDTDDHRFYVRWVDIKFSVVRGELFFQMPKTETEFQSTYLTLMSIINTYENSERCVKIKRKVGSPGQRGVRKRRVLLYLAEVQAGKSVTQAMEAVSDKLGTDVRTISRDRAQFERDIVSNDFETVIGYIVALEIYAIGRGWDKVLAARSYRYFPDPGGLCEYVGTPGLGGMN
jgi:hypothetical protein